MRSTAVDGRDEIRAQLRHLLGDLPSRPTPVVVSQAAITHHNFYTRHDLTIDNGHDSQIPATLLLPTNAEPPYAAVMYCHVHGHRYDFGKKELFAARGDAIPADDLTQRGYAVLCIDAYAFGERADKDEMTLFKRFLWEGRTLWGMMLRDDLIALDYLHAHPEIDSDRVAAVGMSMGSTRAWWLAALDDRIRVTIAVACLPHYRSLIDADLLDHHSIYFYVPGVLKHFDTETILSLIAPRPLLALTGDEDPTSPIDGVRTIERHLRTQYAAQNAEAHFKSIVYPNTGHTFTPQMWTELANWLTQHL